MRRPAQVALVTLLGLFVVAGGVLVASKVTHDSRATELSASPSATPSPHAPDRTVIVASTSTPAVPVSLTIGSVGIVGDPILEYTDEMVSDKGGVDPDSEWDVVWWSGGGRPGADLFNTPRMAEGANANLDRLLYTTYIYGHSGPNPAVFNDIRRLVPGDEVLVSTSGKTYRYGVQEVITVPKPDMPTDPRTTLDQAGRLLLVSCYRPDGYDPDAATVDNVVAVAQLLDTY